MRVQRSHPPPALQRLGEDPARRGGGKGALVVLDSVGTASAVGTVGARGLGARRGARGGRGVREDRLAVRHEDDAVDHLLQLGQDMTGDQDGDSG